ncbi:hypothetical protein BCV72DRAFT_227899 [Rhizopus microsporus var. microsporus]|uniref:Uncharacterized protein n=1 Tax=Rhizopus microsporus var. microsporus TaxID=86635 RepID=A0A1X0R3R1_RHIZD|nr:hypothetical protein BCV72DRAFT_227899 [Rhizopus microsporus var. microsporus]
MNNRDTELTELRKSKHFQERSNNSAHVRSNTDRSDQNAGVNVQPRHEQLPVLTPLASDSPSHSQDQLDRVVSSDNDRTTPNKSSYTSDTQIRDDELSDIKKTQAQKRRLFRRFHFPLPSLPHIRKTVKASIALLISTIFCLVNRTRDVFGSATLLVAIVTIFYFPVRTIGKRTRHGSTKICTLTSSFPF